MHIHLLKLNTKLSSNVDWVYFFFLLLLLFILKLLPGLRIVSRAVLHSKGAQGACVVPVQGFEFRARAKCLFRIPDSRLACNTYSGLGVRSHCPWYFCFPNSKTISSPLLTDQMRVYSLSLMPCNSKPSVSVPVNSLMKGMVRRI